MLKIRAIPKIPTAIAAGDGITIDRTGGVITISKDADEIPNFDSGVPYTIGDVLVADGTNSVSAVHDIATGNVLLSGGVGTAPAYGKVGLTTHVSNTLPAANGGTGAATLTGLVQGNGTGVMTVVTDSSTVGQVLRVTGATTYGFGALDLADTDAITGDLPFGNLTQGSALSLIGVAGNSTADVASIAAGSDLQVMRRSGTSIGFGSIDVSNSAVVGSSRLQLGNLVQGSARSVLGVTGNATADYASMQGITNQVMRVDNTGTGVAFGAINLTSSAAVNGALPVANGGTGAATLTGFAVGNGTSAFTTFTATANRLVGHDGSGVASLITLPAAGLTLSAGALALANDLGALEALASTGIARRTGTDAWSVGTTVSVAEGGTGITSGTSGGILAYTASGTLASSGALTANAIVKGGGAGAAPTASGVSIDSSNNVTGVQGLTVNAASQFNVASSNLGAFDFNVQTGSNSVGIKWSDNGSSKWSLYKNTDNTLNVYDLTNSVTVLTFAQGAIGATTAAFAGTLDASNSTTAALKTAGGFGVAKKAYIGGALNVTDATAATTTSTGSGIFGGGIGVAGSIYAANLAVGPSASHTAWSANAKGEVRQTGNGAWAFSIYNSGASGGGGALELRVDATTEQLEAFYFSTSQVGSITTNGSITAYNISSDRDRKEDERPVENSGQIIDALKIWDFQWKGTDKRSIGVFAQDAYKVFPDAITPSDKPGGWQADYSKYVPLLIAEVQALRKRIADLEAR